ncbi:MAG: recombination mediator RecR [Dehalococcoidia bacterium]|tara:strand:+ start:124 stop:732 length:609 start_codon:yes stop_codon:yes gene_type:complete
MSQNNFSVKSITRLIEEFNKLPGIGPRSAQKLAYHLIRNSKEDARALADSIVEVVSSVVFCEYCQDITQQSPCSICADPGRDSTVICVVEDPLDVLAIERSSAFSGRYHVFHGLLSPMDGIGPDKLRIRELLERLKQGEVKEVLIATNPTLEGEATAMYVKGLIAPLGVLVTRLARGLPSGTDLEFADSVTLARALEGRQEF